LQYLDKRPTAKPVIDQATRMIKAEQPEISVLIITTYDNPDYLLEAIKAGAAGYVLKDAPSRQLTNDMRQALEDDSSVNQKLATEVIQRLASEFPQPAEAPPATESGAGAPAPPPPEELTSREMEVLGLVAQGKTNQEISESLFITKDTTKVHVKHIIRKLGVSDRTQAVVHGISLGLVALVPH
jgi:DNA-binding NarL/FixJ family response regulator